MKISLDWVRDYVDLPTDLDIKQLAHDITLKTVEVEAWTNPAERLAHVVVAQITDVTPLGNKGVLLACDVGAEQPIMVASRVIELTAGRILALALPGARLTPRGGEQVRQVAVAQAMGVDSQGVLVSPADVGLQNLFPGGDTDLLDAAALGVPAGTALATAIGYDDWVLEIDNKSLTNRPDLWGHYGMARELAAIYGLPLAPLPGRELPPPADGLIGTLDPGLCRRFTAVVFELDQHGAAPLWLRSRLSRIGESPHSLCVDLSNYVMLAVGQPTHVYDADRLTGPLSAGLTDTTTKVDLLAGHTRELEAGTPVIVDAHGPVAVAGVIGGLESAVTTSSRRFVLETANFHPQPIRRTSQRLGIRTEASARFEKNLDTQRVDAAVGLFLHLLTDLVPAASLHSSQDVTVAATERAVVEVDLAFLSARIGQRLHPAEVNATLTALGFALDQDGRRLQITAPTWRSTGDISLSQDIIEEVARVRGYDTIPTAGLTVDLKPVRQLHARPLDRVLREQFARAGLQEVITYAWTADALLAAAGQAKDATVRIDAAPAPDRDSLRPSLVPNLIEAVSGNLRYRSEFGIFEVGTVFHAGSDRPYHGRFEKLPGQRLLAAAALAGADGAALFRRAKGILEYVGRHAHLTDLDVTTDDSNTAPWADASARLGIVSEGRPVGTLGLLTRRARRTAGIDAHVAVFEIDVDVLAAHASRDNTYRPVPEYPDSDFDLSVVVADTVTWHDIATTTRAVGPPVHAVDFVGEFRGSWVPDGHRSLSLRVTSRADDHTLTTEDINHTRQAVLDALAHRHGAHLRAT